MNQISNIDHNQIIQTLCDHGYPSYLVGGAIRDIFTDSDPKDFDIATKATPDQISEVFGVSNDTKGKNFGVVILNGFEIATFREDKYPDGFGAKNCEVQYSESILDDLSRRDLTINSLALCPISGDLIDPFDGIKDLKKSIIRFTGNPDQRIQEDPCRILRACRFLCKLEGIFDKETFQALKRNVHRISCIDVERIHDEILKVLKLKNPSIFFNALYLIGALDLVFPSFSKCVNHDHGSHHWENIWEHCMLVGDSISPKFPLVRLAGFLHDCGKPQSYNSEDGSFHGHDLMSAELVDSWLKSLKFSAAERTTVVNLVRVHMLGATSGMSPKSIRKFRKTLYDLGVPPENWMRLRIADRKGNLHKNPFTLGDIKRRFSVFTFEEELPFTVNSLALKGGDLIQKFNLEKGPVVGQLQKHLLEFVIENGSEFNTNECLTEQARKFIDLL